MAQQVLHEALLLLSNVDKRSDNALTNCSVGTMAHNEETSIRASVQATLREPLSSFSIREAIVAGGRIDQTIPILTAIVREAPRIRLHTPEKARRQSICKPSGGRSIPISGPLQQ